MTAIAKATMLSSPTLRKELYNKKLEILSMKERGKEKSVTKRFIKNLKMGKGCKTKT